VARHHASRSRPAQGPRQRRPLQSNVGRLLVLKFWLFGNCRGIPLDVGGAILLRHGSPARAPEVRNVGRSRPILSQTSPYPRPSS
jgi:hypothetical protein